MPQSIVDQEIERAIKMAGNSPQPEWVTHYNRYETHKEDYPLTVSESQYSIEYSVPIYLKIAVTLPIKGKTETELESTENRIKFFDKVSRVMDKPLSDALDSNENCIDYTVHHNWHLERKILQIRVATCLKCDEKQEIELFPLAVDRDIWICKKCGKTHAHARPGWGKPIT